MNKPPVTAARRARAREAGIAAMSNAGDHEPSDGVVAPAQGAEDGAASAAAKAEPEQGSVEAEATGTLSPTEGSHDTVQSHPPGESAAKAATPTPTKGAMAGARTVALLNRADGFVSRQLSRLMASAERSGGKLDKAQVDALTALARMMERWEALVKEQAGQDERRSEDELAAILDRIDARIVELARAEAERLGAAKRARRAGRGSRG